MDKTKQFKSEIGSTATVDRNAYDAEHAIWANDTLVKIGEKLSPNQALEYAGSLTVHVYRAPALKQIMYVKQTLNGKLTEVECSEALSDLANTCQTSYGRKPQTRRSGI